MQREQMWATMLVITAVCQALCKVLGVQDEPTAVALTPGALVLMEQA